MCLQNLKFVAVPVPEIALIGGTQQIWTVSYYDHALISPKYLMGFCWTDPVNVKAKFKVRNFTRS